ncbi:MAG: hypothetical protein AB7P69_19130 [Candidatus Binatia bacterium]
MRKCLVLLAMGVLFFPGTNWAEQMQQPPAKHEQSRPLAPEFAKGIISPILSVLYFPLKFSVGAVGAVVGGVSGWMTGGNIRAAEGIWRPMTGGTYFITPQVMDGERPFLPFDGGEYAQPPPRVAPSGSMMYGQP